VDVAALLGSVVGALAALLGVVSPTYALTLPLVLPVVSLIAALQREDLINEVCRSCAWLSALYSSPWHLLPQHVACSSTVQQYSARTSAVYCFIIGISYTIGIYADSPPALSSIARDRPLEKVLWHQLLAMQLFLNLLISNRCAAPRRAVNTCHN
jgi:hypothetical protein